MSLTESGYLCSTPQTAFRVGDLEGIELMEKLGSGGYGTVYNGMFYGIEVAIKVGVSTGGSMTSTRLDRASRLARHVVLADTAQCMQVTTCEEDDADSQGMRDAVELAIQSSLSHPNIVQVRVEFTTIPSGTATGMQMCFDFVYFSA